MHILQYCFVYSLTGTEQTVRWTGQAGCMRLSASHGTLLQCIVKLQKTGSGSLDN